MVAGAGKKLSERDQAELKEAFDLFDREKSGKLNCHELKVLMRALGFQARPPRGERWRARSAFARRAGRVGSDGRDATRRAERGARLRDRDRHHSRGDAAAAT